MTQTIYPTADVSVGGWSNPTWSVVDDDSDADYSQAETRSGNQVVECHAGDLSDPASASDHVITVRAKYSTNNSRVGAIKVELYEGATLRATLPLTTLTTSFAAVTYTLSTAEANAMTYADIHFKITGAMNAGGLGTSCIVFCSSVKFTCPDAGSPGTAVPVFMQQYRQRVM